MFAWKGKGGPRILSSSFSSLMINACNSIWQEGNETALSFSPHPFSSPSFDHNFRLVKMDLPQFRGIVYGPLSLSLFSWSLSTSFSLPLFFSLTDPYIQEKNTLIIYKHSITFFAGSQPTDVPVAPTVLPLAERGPTGDSPGGARAPAPPAAGTRQPALAPAPDLHRGVRAAAAAAGGQEAGTRKCQQGLISKRLCKLCLGFLDSYD